VELDVGIWGPGSSFVSCDVKYFRLELTFLSSLVVGLSVPFGPGDASFARERIVGIETMYGFETLYCSSNNPLSVFFKENTVDCC
jgi:hypothetical protein